MECHICSVLLFILTLESGLCAKDRFFISAPNVFHMGVKERVFVQMGEIFFNIPVSLYLEDETSGLMVSLKSEITCTHDEPVKTVELRIDREKMSRLPPSKHTPPYLLLVAESSSFTQRKMMRVLVSEHRGYIFIQTDQPVYNPIQKVKYRVFTLDHTMRPHEEFFQLSVFNAAGNRVLKTFKTAKGGIYTGMFIVPDVSEMGTWKISAHYEGDEENAASREFKVQKFVLPSFEVAIGVEQSYLLLDTEQISFTISAKYSYGETVNGAYHCRFGVVTKDSGDGRKVKPDFIRGLELTGSIQDGKATVMLQTAELKRRLQQSELKLYMAVSVTDIQSGELQEAEISLPVVSHQYIIDLSRTRSYFIPGVPLDVVVVLRLPDGSPALRVPVEISVPTSHESSIQVTTQNELEGAVFAAFNFPSTDHADGEITVQVSVEGQQKSKIIRRASSPSGSYLYLGVTNKIYNVGESLSVTYQIVNGHPAGNKMYYMVFSRGILVKQGSLTSGVVTKDSFLITSDMVPSFRLIGYYYSQQGDIIADSVWIDVKDECEKKVTVSATSQNALEIDVHGQRAKVALLAVDKAIYALSAHNKLRAKQVFSSMQSYDLGCSYSGGQDTTSTLSDAGLSFMSQSISSETRKGFGCDSDLARQRRSLDIQEAMMTLKSNFSSDKLQSCCVHGFSLIPMRRTCEERARRVSQADGDPQCAEAFLECCRQGEKLRQRKLQEDTQKALGRTANIFDIEEFFSDPSQKIRRYFPPSFSFTVFDVNNKARHTLSLPDSITTWEIQAISLSATHGFCVGEPYELRVFKDVFVSLRLPYSVKKYEQMFITPVIYNYKPNESVQLAVHMEQTEGLCSPGSATSTAFVNITVAPQSSQFVTFSAVPMVTGKIPIKIRVYDIEEEHGIDAIEKTLNVWTEGVEQRVEETLVVKVDGKTEQSLIIDATLPADTVPDSISNVFIKMEDQSFGSSSIKELLTPQGVADLLRLPTGCSEQTMTKLAPTALALRYFDSNQQWSQLPVGTRDKALGYVEQGYLRMLTYKRKDGSYAEWGSRPSSTWVTSHIVKVLSLVAERQSAVSGQQGRRAIAVSEEEISHSTSYLLSIQKPDGSFTGSRPVMHKGRIAGKDEDASLTAFTTLALCRSFPFIRKDQQVKMNATIDKSTTYLMSNLEELESPYAVAITAYCLSFCLPDKTNGVSAWNKLQALATEGKNRCHVWKVDAEEEGAAINVEATAYALLAAVALNKLEMAESAACWLTVQENYKGGFRSTQDTLLALEALSEYGLKDLSKSFTKVEAQFSVPGKSDIVELSLENRKETVETELKKMIGNNINVVVKGEGHAKLKVVKAYHLLEPKDDCEQLSISVNVEGKVKYTPKIMENYDYYDYQDYGGQKQDRVPRSAIEWFDARTRYRRDVDSSTNSEETVTYEVIVSHSLSRNLTGMAIADITLLSGFEVVTEDLDRLKEPPEEYISHYEVFNGRVLLYFNELFEPMENISFDAIQRVPIGLLQPAPASFYDYYEPNRRCTVFYSAPKRSKMVSKLCSGDVCQCAERPCHKQKSVFESVNGKKITKNDRLQHACFFPTVDYAYIVEVLRVSVKSNFELYTSNITEVLRAHKDMHVKADTVRVFVKRLQCKGQLETGKRYVIMGKDGTTTSSNGEMQYLLESNTWVEQVPDERKCRGFSYRAACRGFNEFVSEYKIDGCRQ